MKSEKPGRFDRRMFAVLAAVIAGIGLPPTGLVSHLLQDEPVGLSRHAWMSAHWSLGIMFVGFAVWHAVLNRRSLVKYLKGSADKMPGWSRELLLAAACVGIVVSLAVLHAFIAQGHRP